MRKYVDEARAVRTVMGLLSIEGVSSREGAVARHVRDELVALGVARKRITADASHKKFPFPAETGNVIVNVPGVGALARARPRMFSAHMDTVELASGARPVRKGGRVVSRGETALGADDRAGVAAILVMLRTLKKLRVDHPPFVLVFTACEETGLWGSRNLKPKAIKGCELGFNFDGSSPEQLVISAPSQDRIVIEIDGIPSHAGVGPEKGASATVAFSRATARLSDRGWLGKLKKGKHRGTSNIGVVNGGLASNIVTPNVRAEGEARSYSNVFLARIARVFKTEFAAAAARTKNASGKSAKAKITVSRLYETFDLGETAPVVVAAADALRDIGLKPSYKRQFGGLDANWLNAHGLPTVTLGAGAHNMHGVSEYLDIKEFLKGCEVAVRLSGADLA